MSFQPGMFIYHPWGTLCPVHPEIFVDYIGSEGHVWDLASIYYLVINANYKQTLSRVGSMNVP